MENIINVDISIDLLNKIKKYTIEKDTIGLSPANVYKLTGSDEILYLKHSPNIYKNTSFCVSRETDIINWLNGKINVPKIVFYENFQGNNFSLMTELKGTMFEKINFSPSDYIKYLVRALNEIQSIDITGCPFESDITFRLNEYKYMLENNLEDTDCDKWEKSTDFASPEELYMWLCQNKPEENLSFSHGDLSGSNILLNNNEIGFIDLGRAGKADKWLDIAFCVMEIRYLFNEEKYVNDFFALLGIEPDWDKINYFILLDELF
jgi:aminoglycoside 3'-phosphotransferase-3